MTTRNFRKLRPAAKAISEKTQNFINALVKEYGEGALVTRAQMIEVRESAKNADEIFPSILTITNNDEYKLSRGVYIATSASDPSKVKKAVERTLNEIAHAA